MKVVSSSFWLPINEAGHQDTMTSGAMTSPLTLSTQSTLLAFDDDDVELLQCPPADEATRANLIRQVRDFESLPSEPKMLLSLCCAFFAVSAMSVVMVFCRRSFRCKP